MEIVEIFTIYVRHNYSLFIPTYEYDTKNVKVKLLKFLKVEITILKWSENINSTIGFPVFSFLP